MANNQDFFFSVYTDCLLVQQDDTDQQLLHPLDSIPMSRLRLYAWSSGPGLVAFREGALFSAESHPDMSFQGAVDARGLGGNMPNAVVPLSGQTHLVKLSADSIGFIAPVLISEAIPYGVLLLPAKTGALTS